MIWWWWWWRWWWWRWWWWRCRQARLVRVGLAHCAKPTPGLPLPVILLRPKVNIIVVFVVNTIFASLLFNKIFIANLIFCIILKLFSVFRILVIFSGKQHRLALRHSPESQQVEKYFEYNSHFLWDYEYMKENGKILQIPFFQTWPKVRRRWLMRKSVGRRQIRLISTTTINH